MIKKALIEKVGIILIVLNIFFVYVKILGFSYFAPAIAGILIINFVNFKKFSINKIVLSFLSVFFIIILSACFHSSRYAFQYVFKFFIGICILISICKLEHSNKMFLIGFIKKMSLIFGAYTIISVFIPTYNRMIVNFLYNSSIAAEALSLFEFQGYSGLAGQTGNNAFLIMFGGTIIICDLFKDKKIKNSSILEFLILLFSILLTNKRSYLFILFFEFLYYFIIYIKKTKLTKKRLMIILISIPIVALFLSYAVVNYKVFSRFGANNFFNRRDIYAYKALDLIKQHPIIGIGISNFPIVSNSLYYAHNVFLQLACEVGIVFSLYIFFTFFKILFSTIKNVYKHIETNYFSSISVLVQIIFLLIFFTGNSFYDANMLYAYFVGLGIYFSNEVVRRKNEKKS